MAQIIDELKERGFIEQVSDEAGLRKLLESKKVTCYVGFDPTAASLHVGSLVPIMALAHLQRAGHRPIVIIGGGTAMIGDPSGKTEMRQMMTREAIAENGEKIREQIGRFVDFGSDRALLVNNADWLLELNYVDFLRDIGRHFSVNRMLAAEAYKIRLETGLSFIEFNYQVLQAYDFLILHRRYGCALQMGGNDQWGNILAGVDLIRRVDGREVYAMTFPLLTTASGAKMGKTAQGAVWLNDKQTSPYDFYQYWINTDDRDVIRFLKFFTFLPLSRIAELAKLQGENLREAKEILAYEVTRLAHGEAAARLVRDAAKALFEGVGAGDDIPRTVIERERFGAELGVVDLFHAAGLATSKSEARRLIEQGGAYVNRNRIDSIEKKVSLDAFEDGALLLRAGKKRYVKVVLSE